MKDRNSEAGFASIYPLTRAEIAALPLADAEDELCAAILAEPMEAAAARPPRRRRRHWGFAGGFGLVGAALAALFVLLGPGVGTEKTTPAFAAGLVRAAKTSPLVLLEEPGWRVGADTAVAPSGGEMHFVGPPRPGGGRRESAELRWRSGRVGARLLRRFTADAPYTVFLLRRVASARMLKIHVRYLQIHVSGRRVHKRFAAVWEDRGRTLIFRSTAANLAAFQKRLGSLRRVGPTAWLTALPEELTRRGRLGGRQERRGP